MRIESKFNTSKLLKKKIDLKKEAEIKGNNNIDTVKNTDTADWDFFIYKIPGHGLEYEMNESVKGLLKTPDVKWANVITQVIRGNKFQQYVIPNKVLEKSAEGVNVESKKAMEDFFLKYIDKYPAKHYFISFEGHSKQIRKIIKPIHEVLQEITKKTGKKIDILAFDSCFMGQAETINEFADVTNYIVASEESVAPWIEVEKLVSEMKEDKTLRKPLELGKQIVKDSGNVTQGLYDTSKVKDFNKKLKAFGQEILNIKDRKALKRLREAIRKSQHFYVPGVDLPKTDKDIKTSVFHTVDIVDFIDNLQKDDYLKQNYKELITKSQDLKKYLQSDELIKKFKLDLSKAESSRFDIVYPEKAHGLSIHLPWVPSVFDNKYTYFKDSVLNKETNWDKVVSHITDYKNPIYLTKAALSTLLGHLFLALSEV